MKIPFRIYELNDIYESLNELANKYLYCPKCLCKNIDLKCQATLLSCIGLDVDNVIFFCKSCNKKVHPLHLNEMREEKINRINKK